MPSEKPQDEDIVHEKESKLQHAIRRYGKMFTDRGLTTGDIPLAFVLHEAVGISLAIAMWTMCYHVQPSKAMANGLTAVNSAIGRTYHSAVSNATSRVARLGWLRRLPGDPARLSVSLAESIGIRAIIKPVTFPFKIWAAYKLTLVIKAARKQSGKKASPVAVISSGPLQGGTSLALLRPPSVSPLN